MNETLKMNALEVFSQFTLGDFFTLGVVIIIISMLVYGSCQAFSLILDSVLKYTPWTTKAKVSFRSASIKLQAQINDRQLCVTVPREVLTKGISLESIKDMILDCSMKCISSFDYSVFYNTGILGMRKKGFSVCPSVLDQAGAGKVKSLTLMAHQLELKEFIHIVLALWGWELLRELKSFGQAGTESWVPLEGNLQVPEDIKVLVSLIVRKINFKNTEYCSTEVEELIEKSIQESGLD